MTSLQDDNTALLLKSIGEALLEKKGEDIYQLDVSKISTITDYFIICHAGTDTQVRALANNVVQKTSEDVQEKPVRKEGLDSRRWITLDYVNVVVHIFLKDLRTYYQLEKMWSDAPLLEITD